MRLITLLARFSAWWRATHNRGAVARFMIRLAVHHLDFQGQVDRAEHDAVEINRNGQDRGSGGGLQKEELREAGREACFPRLVQCRTLRRVTYGTE